MPYLREYVNSKLTKNQYGNKKGLSIEEAKLKAFQQMHMLKCRKLRNTRPENRGHALFIDIKSAFDAVNWEILFNIIQEKHILPP